MKFSKIAACLSAAAVAVTMLATSVFAEVAIDSEYPGAWALTHAIPKSEFEAVGGDVKVTLTIETKEPLIGQHNHLLRPTGANWAQLETTEITSDTALAKNDGFIVIADGTTSVEFVIPESMWTSFVGYDEENPDDGAGLAFQVCDVIVKSADLSAGAPEADMVRVSEDESAQVMDGTYAGAAAVAEEPAAEEPAVVEEAAPVVVETTTSTSTGNTSAAAIAAVMAIAGAAAVVSKRK